MQLALPGCDEPAETGYRWRAALEVSITTLFLARSISR